MRAKYKNRLLFSAIVCACCIINSPQATAYDSLIEAISDTTSPRTYTLNANETTSAVLGTMGGADATFTIDGGTGNYGIINGSSNKDARLYISKQAQTFNLQNVGSYTTTTSDSIIAGKSVITDVVVGNAVKDFGIIDPASANNSSYTGFLRSAGKSNITNSVFYNNNGIYGAALQNRESGVLSVKNSVFVGNASQHGTIHNDSTQKIADISNSIFYNNTAAMVVGSGNKNLSSAIHNKSGKTIDLITGSTFVSNTAVGDSGNIATTIYNEGSIGEISDSIFYNNTSQNSGAIIYNGITGTITTISGSHFVNNTAVGGVLESVGAISHITDSTFKGNTIEKNGIISLHNDTADSTININEINNVQVTDNTGNGIYIRTGKSNSTINIGSITGQSKFNNNTEDGLYMGGNLGIINIDEISDSEFNNNAKTGMYIQNYNGNVGQITIDKIANVKINGNQEGGILLQRNGSNTLQIDEISNVEIKNNTRTTLTKKGAGIYNLGAHIVKMSDVVFENNTLDYTTDGNQGGAIYNNGTIDTMENVSISNCSAFNGGAIYNIGTIGSIVGMTVSNIDTSDVMIASELNGHIETIDDMTIQNSAGTGLSFYGATGGTIKNSTFTNMYGLREKMGYGLQVTAKPNSIDGHVDLIDNITVTGNQTGGMRIDDNESNTHTANVGIIKNSQFTNNGTTGNNKAGGIWAKTDVLTISADGDGKTTLFRGNKRQNQSVGIWMENKNSILNLQQLNKGEMYMYDPINGTNNRYYVNISGDTTGKIHLYDDITNGMVDIQDTNVDTIDGTIHNYTFTTLSSDTDTKYTLDVFFDTSTAEQSTSDTFSITNASLTPETGITRNTTGKITLKALNFLNEDVDDTMVGKSATLQIIKVKNKATNDLGLVNGFEHADEGFVLFTLQNDKKTEYDEVTENTDWSDKIKIYDVTKKVLGNVEILTTDTTDDTLKITIAESTKNRTWTGDYLDTLMAVNQAELATRNFTTSDADAVYNVTSNLGETAAGNFNIVGPDSEHSLIDFNATEHYKGFELNNATNLTLENVEIKNSYQLVSGIATDSNINIYNSYLHDNGKGIYLAGNANIEGTTQINDDLYLMGDTSALTVKGQIRGGATPADITFNKKLAGSGTSTFTFSSGKVTLGENASIADTNLVLENTTLNVGADSAFSNVNLTAGNTQLNLKNESTGDQTFNTLTLNNDINIDIDVDLQNRKTDKIIVSNTGDEAVVANGHKIIIDSLYIMTDGTETTTNVELTNDNRLKGVYKLSDDILDNITQASTVSGYYSVSYKDFDSSVDANKGILVFINSISSTLASTIVKEAGDDAIKAYMIPTGGETAETNLGTLSGKNLTITGNGETGTNFIKGQDLYTGVTIGDGKTQTLEVNNVAQLSGFTDSAIINKSDGTVKINNVNFSGNGTSDIDNSGKLEFSGTNSLEKVNDSNGNGTTEIKGGSTTITDLQQESVTISGGKLVISNNLTTTSGITNSVENGLEIKSGTINSDISGSGSTNINSTSTVTNNGTISQTINLTSGTFNTNADGVKGGLTVASGTVVLTGGELTTAITGSGATKVEGDVTVGSDGSIENAVTIQGTGSQLTAALSDLTGGVTVESGNSLNLQGQIANGISGTGNVILNTQQDITSDISFGGTLDLNGQTINLQDADLSASTPAHVYTPSTTPAAPTFQTLTVGSLKGPGSLKIDVDMATTAGNVATNSDKIYITDGANNSGTLTLTSVNVTDAGTMSATQYNDYVTYVTGTTSGLTINGSTDTITSDNRRFTFSQGSAGKLNVIIREANTTLAQFIKGDNIVAPVSASTFSLTGDLGVKEDLGTTKRDGTPPDPSTLYLNLNNHTLSSDGHNGATVDKGYTLNVDGGSTGGNVSGFTTAFTTTADTTNPGTLTINNVTFGTNTTDIDNNGKTEISGTNSINTMTGSGSTEIKSGTTSFTGTAADSITQDSITITGGTLNANANVFNVANGINNSGTVNLTGGILDTAITGSGTTEITAGSGTVAVGSGSIGNNVTISSGTLASDITKLSGNITNNATFNMTGDLSKDIAGSGETILQSDVVAVTDGTNVAGSLNVNSKTLDMNNTTFETLTVGNLKGNANLTLDINAVTDEADTIDITTGSANSSTLTITALNLTKPTISGDSGEYTRKILTGNSSGAILDLSDSLKTPVVTDIDRTGTDSLDTNTISWNANYGNWEQTGTQTEKLSIESSGGTLKDSIKYSLNKDWNPKEYTSKDENLAIMNQYNGTGSDNRSVNFSGIFADPSAQGTYTVKDDLGTTESGKMALVGETNGESKATINFDSHTGFVLDNDNTELVLKDLEIKNSSSLISGNAGNNVKVVLDNVNIYDNGSGIATAGNVEIKGNSNVSDNIQVTGTNSQIDIDGSDTVSIDASLMGVGTSKLNITNGTVNLGNNANISGLETTLQNTNLNIANEALLNGLNTTFNGTNNLNMANGNVGTLSLGNINLNGTLKMQIDADLANEQMDKLSATSAIIGSGGKIEVSKINLLSPTTQKQLDLLFTNNSNLAGVVNYTGEGQIAYSPIYKYNTSYIRGADGSGHFRFETQGNGYGDFNPSVMASSVTAIITGYQNQMQALHQGFYHMDRYMKHSDKYRFAAENQNKFASLAPLTDFEINKVPETTQAMWTIPYTTFERVNLKGGVKVNNTAYGMTYGGDSNMFDMGHGFKGVISGFIGYNGNHMTYDGISMTQNGGFLGATFNAYKGNFYTGLTVSTGASSGDADTMYGHDNITLLTAGVANKTGYNFEFLDGKIILQPSLFLGYSWVNTFDYTNSAGVRINQDALNAIQIVPGIKVIGNTKNGWQPYAGVDMVWNIFMGRNQVNASDVVLPQLSERAYVQYGAGVQKTWADRFTGFLQAMVRNGGRNGIVLSAGLRWTFGKDNTKTKKTEAKQKTVIK